MRSLFGPMHLGDLVLPNRIVLAPLSRRRAGAGGIPTALMAEYYAQRASAGLILSEGSPVAPPLQPGYEGVPGMWSDDQVEGWRGVTRAVKRSGGRMFAQLWHAGAQADPHAKPPAPARLDDGRWLDDVAVLANFRAGLRRARASGFDGVEIQGGKGLLADVLGGDADRLRLTLEVVDAAIEIWGAGRVGFHFGEGTAPSVDAGGEAGTSLAEPLGRRRIAFLFGRERPLPGEALPRVKAAAGRPYIVNAGFDGRSAQQAVEDGWADAVAFGVPFIANPDLPHRLKIGAPLEQADPSTFRSGGAEGYVTYG